MEQEADLFTLKRFELMIDMATKKLQNEVNALKENISSLNSELSSLRSQFSRFQFQNNVKSEDLAKENAVQNKPASKPAQSSPRSGNYKPEDVSIYKFFYFGDKK